MIITVEGIHERVVAKPVVLVGTVTSPKPKIPKILKFRHLLRGFARGCVGGTSPKLCAIDSSRRVDGPSIFCFSQIRKIRKVRDVGSRGDFRKFRKINENSWFCAPNVDFPMKSCPYTEIHENPCFAQPDIM